MSPEDLNFQSDTFDSPNMVSFITRFDEYFIDQIENNPNISPGKTLSGDYTVVYIPRDKIEETLEQIGQNIISIYPAIMGLLGQSDLEAAGIIQAQQQPYLDLRGQGVLLGFIDTGIDYTNNAFRYEDGSTKIKAIWDQTIAGRPPVSYRFGTEYTEEQINEALSSDNPFEHVPSRDTVGHGTFLASVAGSRESGEYIGAAPDAEMLVVKLRKANPFHLERYMVPPDQENAFSSNDLMLGVEYMIEKANELDRPIAICIGLGTNAGGHDGFNIMEEYLARSANRTGVSISVAAGNEVLAQHHTQGRIDNQGDSRQIEVTVGEGATGGFNFQIWNAGADRISVSVTSPTGESVGRIPARVGPAFESKLVLERATVSIQYFFPLPGSGAQMTWIKVTDPTPGIWTIGLFGDIIIEGTFHAWLPMTGFIDPKIQFLAPSPNSTITLPGTALGVMTLGAYSTATKGLYANSSWGPTRLPSISPDLVAPGVDVSGIYPTGYGTMSGTSVAAAIATGACAQMLQWGIIEKNDISMNTFLIRAYFIRGCDRDPGITYPNDQWGYGRLNLINAFNQLRATSE